jgi:hypothetical protein
MRQTGREKCRVMAVVNPRQVRQFAAGIGQRAKTDPIDARVLAHFAAVVAPPSVAPPDPDRAELAALLDRRRQLLGMRVWGRWAQYAQNGHGGNKRLVELLAKDADYPTRFRFSLLQILPKTFTKDEVIKREAVLKQKLGTRATRLNLN